MNERITSDPQVCGGEPCVKGTCIPVRIILSHIASGEDYSIILKQFPRIQIEDIMACLEYGGHI